MTELEKAADDFFPIDEKEMSLDEQSDQLLRQIGFKFGAEWQYEQFDKERLKHCDGLSEEQYKIESDFVTEHLKKNNRTPTFIDAIEYGSEAMKEKLTKLKELADNMYHAAFNITTDASHLHKAMDDYRKYVIKELKEE